MRDGTARILLNAKNICLGATILNDRVDLHPYILIPQSILLSHTIELIFKAIYFEENGVHFAKNHDLCELWRGLNAYTRKDIREKFAKELGNTNLKKKNINRAQNLKIIPVINKDIVTNLKYISRAFVNYRYLYEGISGKASTIYAGEVLCAALAHLFEKDAEIGTLWEHLNYSIEYV